MMPQGIRSQNPGMPNQMNSLPNNPQGMNNMRMSGPGGQVSVDNSKLIKLSRYFYLLTFLNGSIPMQLK
jgi:hypothetical protein